MRRTVILLALATSMLASLTSSAFGTEQASFACYPSYANYTGCATITNNAETWVAPGKLAKSRPLVFAGWQSTTAYWDAQTSIAGGASGDAITGGPLWADGAALYSYRPTPGPENYQAVVGFRLSSNDAYEGCIATSYLDCTMGPQLETGRDSKHAFTITSRPFEVKITNAMPVALKRVDGPFWTNALPVPAAFNASLIGATSGVGHAGSLRSISKTSAYAAVYKFVRNEADPRFNADSVLISVKTTADGKRTGTCTPVYPPSGTRFACSVTFAGSNVGTLTATVRVYIP